MENKTSRSRTWLTNNIDGKWHDFPAITVWAESQGWPLMKVTLQDYITPIGVYHTGDPIATQQLQRKVSNTWKQMCQVGESFFNTVTGIRSEFLELHPPYSRRFDALCARWVSIFHTVESRKRDVVLAVRRRKPMDMIRVIREVANIWSPAANQWNDLFARAFPRKGWKEYIIAYNFSSSLDRIPYLTTIEFIHLLPQINNDLTNLLSHWYLAAFVQKWTYHGRPDNELELQRAGPAMLLSKSIALAEMAHRAREEIGPDDHSADYFEHKELEVMNKVLVYIKEMYIFCRYHGLHPIDANQFPWNPITDFAEAVNALKSPTYDVFYQLLETPSIEGCDQNGVDSLLTVRWNLMWRMECMDLWILRTRLLLAMPPQWGALYSHYQTEWVELYGWHVNLAENLTNILASEEQMIPRVPNPSSPLAPRQNLVHTTTKIAESCGARWRIMADPIADYVKEVRRFSDHFPSTLNLATDPESVFLDDDRIIFSNPSSIIGHPVIPHSHSLRGEHVKPSEQGWSLTMSTHTHWCLVRHSLVIHFTASGPQRTLPALAFLSCLTRVFTPAWRPITISSTLLAQDLVISLYKYGGKTGPI